jgi:excisionase family DNA binding protein
MLDNIIGVEEAARILGLSPGTVKNMCADGKLECKKIGKTWVLDTTKLEEKKMEKLNYTKMNGKRYKLPDGFYAINKRFGDQVFNERNENVTQKIMGNSKGDGYIILTDQGIADLELLS